jgi:hypothetical protein
LFSWEGFLTGLLANLQERQFAATGWPELCPIIFADPLGFLVIMPRCMPLRLDLWADFDVDSFRSTPTYFVPVENKYDSFGYLKGQIVAIDYGS